MPDKLGVLYSEIPSKNVPKRSEFDFSPVQVMIYTGIFLLFAKLLSVACKPYGVKVGKTKQLRNEQL